jgi:hypothetical protein
MPNNTTLAGSRKVALTFTLPSIHFDFLLGRVKDFFTQLFASVYNPINNTFSQRSEVMDNGSSISRSRFPRIKRGGFHFNKKYFKIIFPIIIGIVVLAALASLIRSLPDAQSKPVDTSTNITAPDSLSTINLNKKFTFPLKDDKGATVGNFDYVIESAEIQKQIIVQGQRATAVNGRDFLILNLKITNNLKKTIQLNTRDYIRLTVASNPSEQLAPDIHNDPVEVQAISTKFTRVGIALDEADTKKTIRLKIGEIDGTKQDIDLNFKF